MDTCLWRPVCWFRAGGANDTTLERLSGLEDAEVMPRWLESMKSASPIVLTDTSEIRESCPVEYALYERLDARSIIASPFSPSPTGFLVIRNPSRYLNHPEALFIFAYVLHRALAQQNTMEREKIIEAMNPIWTLLTTGRFTFGEHILWAYSRFTCVFVLYQHFLE